MLIQRSLRVAVGVSAILVSSLSPASLWAGSYTQTNLVSDIPGLAAVTDSNLADPWGVAFSATGPFWVSDNHTNVSTLYTGTPSTIPLIVAVPGGPTGQVYNSNSSAFVLASNNKAARFIFDTQAGTILAWNGGTTATPEYSNSKASYTGLAIGTSDDKTFIYAANAAGSVDVFNSSFAPTTLTGTFIDPTLPAGYVPYNVQAINGQLYVTFVKYNSAGTEIPSGIVDIFSTNGTFAKRFSSSSVLDAPWGITLAPLSFGAFGGDILVGNFLNGYINAFDPFLGSFLGTLADSSGNPISNPGLWALDFRTGGTGNSPNSLYFTAGIDGETHGLFGAISPTPEPSSFILAGMGVLSLIATRFRTSQA